VTSLHIAVADSGNEFLGFNVKVDIHESVDAVVSWPPTI
jgi:hypothetical protein